LLIDITAAGYDLVANFGEHGNVSSDFLKGEEFAV
jgi:hypothetical protein